MSTLAAVQRIMGEELELPPEKLDPQRSLEDVGFDSLGVLEVMFKLEDNFGIKMPDERVPIRTVQDIVDIVDRLVQERDGAKA